MARFGNARHPSVATPAPAGHRGRIIPGNAQVTTAVVHGPDRQSLALAASMAIAVNTDSPMSAGINSRFWGDPGYGVNRWAGRTTSPQAYVGAAVYPVHRPPTARVGAGYGAVDGSAYPNTATSAAEDLSALAAMSSASMTRAGMG
jgi:hypothetical protein